MFLISGTNQKALKERKILQKKIFTGPGRPALEVNFGIVLDSSAPSIQWPWVWSPITTRFQFIFELWWEKDEIKQKEDEIGTIYNKKT